MENLHTMIFIYIVVIFLCFVTFFRKKPKVTHKIQKPEKPQVVSEYDSEGYNRQGYNEAGRNRQGKYNRYYNVKCYIMDALAFEAYQFGKSKL